MLIGILLGGGAVFFFKKTDIRRRIPEGRGLPERSSRPRTARIWSAPQKQSQLELKEEFANWKNEYNRRQNEKVNRLNAIEKRLIQKEENLDKRYINLDNKEKELKKKERDLDLAGRGNRRPERPRSTSSTRSSG